MVPRATRGWAYGSAIVDPRTGEIINGHVNLDALRIRQVFLIAQWSARSIWQRPRRAPASQRNGARPHSKLAAHETGHTLGLMHNYAGSIVNRSSVMTIHRRP